MMRTVPRIGQRWRRGNLVPRLAAPDIAGVHATSAGFGGLLVFAVLMAASAPSSLAGFVGVVTLVLLVAGITLPLHAAPHESP